jgi:hypothetical protein
VGSSWRHMVACMYCTSAEGIAAAADGDVDCKASSYSHPAACLALPADDDRSSCRLGRLSFQTDRVLDRVGDAFAAARCRMNCSRRGLVVRLKTVSASKRKCRGCLRVMVDKQAEGSWWTSQSCRMSHVHLRLLCRCAQNYGAGAGEKFGESAEASPRQNSQAENNVRQR